MNPHAYIRSRPPEGAECHGSKPACAGLAGKKNRRVSQRCGLQDDASFEAARQEAPCQ
jgi:hypothetical protein